VDSSDSKKTVIKAHTFISPPVLDWGWNCEVEYTVHVTGALGINVARLAPTGSFPEHVPRIGLNVYGNKGLEHVNWFGLGPGESYPDKKLSQRVGIWGVESVSDLHTHYDVPQENGNRMEARWLTLRDAKSPSIGLKATRLGTGEQSHFSFVVSRHRDDTIQKAKHPHNLFEEDATLFRLDAKVAGVGTAACGPGVREDLLVKTEEVSFNFLIEPL
jgi:beta-galactosidase